MVFLFPLSQSRGRCPFYKEIETYLPCLLPTWDCVPQRKESQASKFGVYSHIIKFLKFLFLLIMVIFITVTKFKILKFEFFNDHIYNDA